MTKTEYYKYCTQFKIDHLIACNSKKQYPFSTKFANLPIDNTLALTKQNVISDLFVIQPVTDIETTEDFIAYAMRMTDSKTELTDSIPSINFLFNQDKFKITDIKGTTFKKKTLNIDFWNTVLDEFISIIVKGKIDSTEEIDTTASFFTQMLMMKNKATIKMKSSSIIIISKPVFESVKQLLKDSQFCENFIDLSDETPGYNLQKIGDLMGLIDVLVYTGEHQFKMLITNKPCHTADTAMPVVVHSIVDTVIPDDGTILVEPADDSDQELVVRYSLRNVPDSNLKYYIVA